jgi:hypothetical protein
MKLKLLLVALTLLMVLAPSAMAKPVEYDVVVTGTDTYPDDVDNVQEAVDNYDKILLTGTFDFGDDGTVAVTRDGVQIHGEKYRDEFKTTIKGGHVSFLVGSTATGFMEWVENPSAIVELTDSGLEDVFFENPMYAVVVLSCHGELNISGNKVVDSRPVAVGGNPHNHAFLVASIGANWDPTVITADITITDNYIDGMGRSWAEQPEDDPWAVYSEDFGRWYRGIPIGIDILDVDARAHIARNEIRNTMEYAIRLVNDHTSDIMAASVTRNTLVPSPTEMWGDPMDLYGLSVYAAHNQVEVANPGSWGVACLGCYDSVFARNRIHLGGGNLAGISFNAHPDWGAYFGEVSNVLVRANQISGWGESALLVGRPASYNTFVGNNLSGFTPSKAHYIFEEGANHNLVVGEHGVVIDNGEGNRITGLTGMPGNIGQQVSDAMQTRRELVQQLRW